MIKNSVKSNFQKYYILKNFWRRALDDQILQGSILNPPDPSEVNSSILLEIFSEIEHWL